ncbi:LamB/YcsF family protein [Niallia sp. 01092]|uniref:LamB/YcsF family protein n=1 Tax=unclassified Niallia TaxID=2837522 RepID=UPI003FD452DC
MRKVIDIISDLGEGFGSYTMADDSSLLELVSSANIACGFHAGDPRTMADAVEKSVKNNVGIGAHPGFPDLVGFGRRHIELSSWEITTDILYQLGALNAFVKAYGGTLQHVTPHGRLGNLSVENRKYAEAIVEGIVRFDPSLMVVTTPGEMANIAEQRGLKVAYVIFADRAYNDDGTLVSRDNPNAVIHDPETVVKRCVKMVVEGKVTSITGKEIEVDGQSLLLHGDTSGSLKLAQQIKSALIEAGVEIRRLGDWF